MAAVRRGQAEHLVFTRGETGEGIAVAAEEELGDDLPGRPPAWLITEIGTYGATGRALSGPRPATRAEVSVLTSPRNTNAN